MKSRFLKRMVAALLCTACVVNLSISCVAFGALRNEEIVFFEDDFERGGTFWDVAPDWKVNNGVMISPTSTGCNAYLSLQRSTMKRSFAPPGMTLFACHPGAAKDLSVPAGGTVTETRTPGLNPSASGASRWWRQSGPWRRPAASRDPRRRRRSAFRCRRGRPAASRSASPC